MPPILELPPTYREVKHLVVTEGNRLLWLNFLALIPLAASIVLLTIWWRLVVQLRGTIPGGSIPWWIGLPVVMLVLFIHELIHAAAIRLVGHQPRIGAKLHKGVLYATADGAYFRRGEFILVALAPLMVISLAGMLLMMTLPDALGYWISLAVVLNAGGAIGDLWMTVVVLQHPATALIRDEEDGIRVFESV
jgi:hypothetical protein